MLVLFVDFSAQALTVYRTENLDGYNRALYLIYSVCFSASALGDIQTAGRSGRRGKRGGNLKTVIKVYT